MSNCLSTVALLAAVLATLTMILLAMSRSVVPISLPCGAGHTISCSGLLH